LGFFRISILSLGSMESADIIEWLSNRSLSIRMSFRRAFNRISSK
jgi:hypothetical protein